MELLLVWLVPRRLEFSLTQEDQEHTTVQAAWALYLLKYRYPDWINQNFK